jgi:superfamily II DNA/RNA helicase
MTILAKVSNHLELLKPDPALAQTDPYKFQIQTLVAEMALGEDARMLGGADRPDGDFQRLSSTRHCGKLAALEKLLRLWHGQNDKVLVFSVSTRLLDILERFMTRHGYVFSRLDGTTNQKHRQTVVDDFNASRSTFAFLLSTRAGGVGLNIVSANRVVIFDPNWNPALDLQAQDRSYRIGQRRDVDVYRLLTSGTLEELVYQRQVYKQQQSNVAVEGVEERRYFEGVQGDKEQKGELFGVANVFAEVARALQSPFLGTAWRMRGTLCRSRERRATSDAARTAPKMSREKAARPARRRRTRGPARRTACCTSTGTTASSARPPRRSASEAAAPCSRRASRRTGSEPRGAPRRKPAPSARAAQGSARESVSTETAAVGVVATRRRVLALARRRRRFRARRRIRPRLATRATRMTWWPRSPRTRASLWRRWGGDCSPVRRATARRRCARFSSPNAPTQG